jgi:predicted transcriptional regulator
MKAVNWMSLRDTIEKELDAKEETTKKLISVNLDSELLDRLDRVAQVFTKQNSTRTFSRNYLIELAIRDFVEEAEQVLRERGVDIEQFINENRENDFDLVIFPAANEGFESAFLGEKRWYAVRIREDKIPKIKYVACYRKSPISGVTHYAKVKRIEQYNDTDKKIIYFEGEPVELPQVVKIGEASPIAMRSPRYTTLDKLKRAIEIGELF